MPHNGLPTYRVSTLRFLPPCQRSHYVLLCCRPKIPLALPRKRALYPSTFRRLAARLTVELRRNPALCASSAWPHRRIVLPCWQSKLPDWNDNVRNSKGYAHHVAVDHCGTTLCADHWTVRFCMWPLTVVVSLKRLHFYDRF